MGLPKAAASLLGIQPGEGRSASLMLAHSFAMGVGTTFFETTASALFLAHFGAPVLPYVYIAAAVLNTLTGLLYTGVQHRLPFRTLMVATLLLLVGATGAFRVGLLASSSGVLVFLLLVFYRIVSALTDLEYWAVATRLYDVRQAKRLFGVIGSGEVVARIAGSFSVPLLVERIGVANLLVISAAGLAACLLLVVAVLRSLPGEAARAPRRKGAPRPAGGLAPMLGLVRGPYLRLLLAITFFAILSKYLVDYAFLAQMKGRYGGARELASFFGLFSGATQLLSLLTRLLVSGRLLARHGIRVGLLVLPLAHALCTALLVLAAIRWGAGTPAVFWLVMMNQGIYKTLKHPIDNPSFKVLYQPLRAEQRLAAQIVVETIVTPLTTGLAGGLMLLFTVALSHGPVSFSAAMLAVFAGWAAVAVRAGRAYSHALSEALRSRIVDEDLDLDDERTIAVVKESLRSERPAEVVFALDLLEKARRAELGSILLGLLDHPSPDVRASVLSRLERVRAPTDAEAVAARLARERSPEVRAAALRCLCAIGGPEAPDAVAAYVEDPDPQVSRAAMIGLLGRGSGAAPLAASRLVSLAGSAAPEDRASAAHVIGQAGRTEFREILRGLLADGAAPVRRAALRAASRVKDPELWPAVTPSLGDPAFGDLASLALTAGGEGALPALEAAWARDPRARVRARVASVWGRIGGAPAVTQLLRQMGYPDERVRHAVLESLRRCGYRAGEDEAGGMVRMIEAEAADAAWALAAIRDLADDPRLLTLVGALEREVEAGRQRVFLLLSLIHDPTTILRARDNLRHESKERRAYALEILEVTLARETRQMVFPLVEDLSLAERGARLAALFPQEPAGRGERLRQLLARPAEWIAPWTRACAIYSLGVVGAPLPAEHLQAALEGGDPMVREAAAWVSEGAGGRNGMLSIEKAIVLKAVPMFARTSDDVLADIAALVEEVQVEAGETIFEKGDAGDSLYVIVAGRVRVFVGGHTLAHLGPRDIFGELALLDPEPRAASIAAVDGTRLLRLDREAFAELMAGNIEIVRGVLSVLCERLRRQASEPAGGAGAPIP
jgi:HEAT repeat protein